MQAAATCTSVTGQVTVDRNGEKLTVSNGMELFVTDTVHTGNDGKVSMRFRDDTELDLHPDTHAQLEDFVFDPSGTPPPTFAVEVMQGLARTATGKVVQMNPDGFAITTPLGTAGIRGTTIWTHVTSSQVVFSVTEMGKGHMVVVSSLDGSTLLIKVPDSGVVITTKGEATLNMEHLTPEKLQQFIDDVVGKATDNEAHINATSHGVFVIADAEFLAAIGAINITDELGFIAAEDSSLMIDALDMLGFSMDEHFMEYSHVPGPHDPSPGPNPYNYIYGTQGNDVLTGTSGMDRIYAYGGNDEIYGGKGNDTIWSEGGQDIIYGGYGSHDEIYKLADLGGSEIYGDVQFLHGAAGDADYIEIGTSSANNHVGNVFGDAAYITGNGMPGNDVIKVYGTLRGHVLGDAHTFYDALVGTDPATGDEALGQDSIYVETLDGRIYGEGEGVIGVLSGNVANAFNDTIKVGTMSGGDIIGDFWWAESTADVSGLGPNAFADKITVGNMTGSSSIYGDFVDAKCDGITFGNDTISIKNTMSQGVIYGDSEDVGAKNVTFGNDLISVGGNMKNGATILGDANALQGTNGKLGNDTISITGSMNASTIFGDLRDVETTAQLGNDKISVGGNMTNGAQIFGDADALGGAGSKLGNDTISVTGNMNASTIFGDLRAVDANAQLGNDKISVGGNMTNGAQIFGDADALSGAGGKLGNDTISVTGNMDSSTIFGDLRAVDANAQLGNDKISVGGTIKDSLIYGDAADINAPDVTCGNDTITITGSLESSKVYGDAVNIQTLVAPGNDSITVGTVEYYSQIFGDAHTISTARVTAENGGNDTITVTDQFFSIYGDARNLSGPISAASTPSQGAFSDEITVTTVSEWLTIGQGLAISIYGDFQIITNSAQINLSDDKAFSDKITVGTLGGNIYGDAQSLYARWAVGGHDTINVNTMKGGDVAGTDGYSRIVGDAAEVNSLANNSIFGNDEITIGSLKFAHVYGDAVMGHEDATLSGFRFGNDKITLITAGSDMTILGDALGIPLGSKLGHDTIDASTATISDTVFISGDGYNMYGADLTDAAKLGRDLIKVGTMNSANVQITGDAWYLTGTLNGNEEYAFSDTIEIGTMVTGEVVGDFSSVSRSSTISTTGWYVFNDVIKIDTMKGGTVCGDFMVWNADNILSFSGFAGCEKFCDTITIGNMQGGSVYGDAQSINHSLTSGSFGGGTALRDSITVTNNMSGGAIYGDTGTLRYGSNTNAYLHGDNTISINGTMSDGAIYGSAAELAIGGGNSITLNNTINIGTLNGNDAKIWAYFNQSTSGTLATGSTSKITINSFKSGQVYMGNGKDSLTINDLTEYVDSSSTINFGGNDDTLSLGSYGNNLTYTPGTTITIDKDFTDGSFMSVRLFEAGLVVNNFNTNNERLVGGKLYLTENADDVDRFSGVILDFGIASGNQQIHIIA